MNKTEVRKHGQRNMGSLGTLTSTQYSYLTHPKKKKKKKQHKKPPLAKAQTNVLITIEYSYNTYKSDDLTLVFFVPP